MKAAKRSKVGRPCSYSEPKSTISVGITHTAVQGLDSLAKEFGLCRSELVEQIGRGVFVITPPQSQLKEDSLPEAS